MATKSRGAIESTPHLLIVDDDEVDREAIRRTFRRNNLDNEISVAADGQSALVMLRCDARDGVGQPRVVILDWNMPGFDGEQTLCSIRADPALAKTVVFVLTSSDDARDIEDAYSHNIAGYIVKSTGLKGLSELIRSYNRYIKLPD